MTRTPLSRSKGQISGHSGRGHIVAASCLQLVLVMRMMEVAATTGAIRREKFQSYLHNRQTKNASFYFSLSPTHSRIGWPLQPATIKREQFEGLISTLLQLDPCCDVFCRLSMMKMRIGTKPNTVASLVMCQLRTSNTSSQRKVLTCIHRF